MKASPGPIPDLRFGLTILNPRPGAGIQLQGNEMSGNSGLKKVF
jgi:hypothetical protein